ncbi:MAG: hypothetical protein K940chlam8_00057 [Chlamydiae bacterium]|nr:hypothetical protein [Chlamydiota bacterium]
MDKLFRIHFPIQDNYGTARPPGGLDSVEDLPRAGSVKNWEPLYFNLEEGDFADYQGNSPVFKMCSVKMKTILDENKGSEDEMQWLRAFVKSEQGEEREYYIQHFPKFYDTVDWDRCILQKDKSRVIKPVFSRKKIEGKHKIFNYPKSRLALVITEDIKKKLQKAKCTGIVFSKVPLVD